MQRQFPAVEESKEIKGEPNPALLKRIMESEFEVFVTSQAKGIEKCLLSELVAKTLAAGKVFILTVTPGPFVDFDKDAPVSEWKKTPEANGCTLQLQDFEKMLKEQALNADIFAINIHAADYQMQLLAKKILSHVAMISSAGNLSLKNMLDLEVMTLGDKDFFKRFTFVIKSKNDAILFKFPVPKEGVQVDAGAMNAHVKAIKQYVPFSELKKEAEQSVCSLAMS